MKRRTRAQWLALIQQQQSSGLNASAFCREQGVSPKYFSRRRRQLLGAISGACPEPAFVPVTVQRSVGAPDLEVRLGAALHVRVPMAVSPRWLAELLHALRD